MTIITFIDWFKIGNGGTSAVTVLNRHLNEAGFSTFVFFDHSDGQLPDNVYPWDEDHLLSICRNAIDCVFHFVLSGGIKGRGIFGRILHIKSKYGLESQILTTVVQRPSYAYTLLNADIIKGSQHFVFIDKTSYNDSMYKFIPEERKSMLYCSYPYSKETIEQYDNLARKRIGRNKKEVFIYGRGSVINKCPSDTIELFKKINVSSKKMIICGVDDDTWIAQKAQKETNIETYPNKEYQEWVKICSTFDVFLYYLPKKTYSSLDGNLGLAMKLAIPPIVYGPAAPKERIVHGVNGFIAEDKEDIVKYAELLYKDDSLRERMGKAARDMTYSMFHGRKTIDGYICLFRKLNEKKIIKSISIPVSFVVKCWYVKIVFYTQFIISKLIRGVQLLFTDHDKLKKKILR